MARYILGISCNHDGSVALVKDRKLVAYIQTERLTRYKKERGVTKETIKYVLSKEGIKLKDVSCVAVTNWFGDTDAEGRNLWDKEEEGFSITTDNGVEYSRDEYVNFFASGRNVANGFYILHIGEQQIPCIFIDHHFAHCCSAFYLSPFKESICLSVDFADNVSNCHSVYYLNDEYKFFRPIRRGGDFDIGSFYGSICDFLGFYPSLTDAGKVMALAAYGEPDMEVMPWSVSKKIGDLFHGDQYFQLLYKFGIKNIPDRRVYYPQLHGEGGEADPAWLKAKDWNADLNKNIAATAQKVLEDSISNLVRAIAIQCKNTNNICLAGGTMLNCVSNGLLLNNFTDHNFFVPPAPGDDGLSIGAAFFVAQQIKRVKGQLRVEIDKSDKPLHTNVECFAGGVEYTDKEIFDTIKSFKSKVQYEVLDDTEVIESVADAIKKGNIVAYFEGESEIGPRALGHRSILGDARDPEMKDIINNQVKHREGFRPFAPMVLAEEAGKWFELPSEDTESPFMLFSVKCLQPDKIPSGIHVDDSARLQTISEENGRIYWIIKEFFNMTEVPVIINTSFNVKGEPIVETPDDAIRCFLGTEMDVLVLGNYWVTKK